MWLPTLEAFEAGAFAVWLTDKEILVATRPAVVSVDDRRRLHREDGPAFDWMPGLQDFYWHGVHVPDFVIAAPEKITAHLVEKEQNAEVRRVMIERYVGGQAQYLVEAGAKKIHEDDYGVLYRKELPDDEPLVMVKVVNSTAEPDGTFKDYFLRVPPTCTTAREAVAWTFDVPPEAYEPLVET